MKKAAPKSGLLQRKKRPPWSGLHKKKKRRSQKPRPSSDLLYISIIRNPN